jgi:DNA polymerase-1
VIRDAEALAALASELRAAGRFGVAVLSEGGEGTGRSSSGSGSRCPTARAGTSALGRRLLGDPPALGVDEVLAALGPHLADPGITKSIHDGKYLAVLLAMRGHQLAGVTGDTLLAAYLLDASRTRYDLDVLAVAAGLTPLASRGHLAGQRTQRPDPGGDPRRGGGRACGRRRPRPAAALSGLQQNALGGAGLAALTPTWSCRWPRCWPGWNHTASASTGTSCASWGKRLSGNIASLEQDIHRLAGTTFNIGSPKQLGEVLFGKLQLPVIRRTKTGPSTDADVLEEAGQPARGARRASSSTAG